MLHSLWNGTVEFGMVRVPVKLYSATESKAIRFNERHATDGAAIAHRRLCVHENREVPYAEIVKGFEVSKDTFVTLTKQELAAADGPTARVVAIEHFVDGGQIDPLYFERLYYLGPGGHSAEAYLVLQAALKRTGMIGIGRFVFHNNARLVAVRAVGEVIGLHTMRFADEVLPTAGADQGGAAAEDGSEQAEVGKRELDTAALLIDRLTAKFEAHKYRDKHREALLELIEAKARGETFATPQSEPATDQDRLLEALEASLAATPSSPDPDGSGKGAGGGRSKDGSPRSKPRSSGGRGGAKAGAARTSKGSG